MLRPAEYQIMELILENSTPLIKQCSPKFRQTCRRWLTGCNSSSEYVPHMLYWIQILSDAVLRLFLLAVNAKYTGLRRCNSGATCAVTSTHITIILESLPKPGDDTLGDSKFLGYFQLGTPTFQTTDKYTT
ncbi:uncharacterized protein TNCV_3063171 [Trichonephila clavipes]|nr:uncharacterized protein TNCV_3063171 [Trichonephila clavipes]